MTPQVWRPATHSNVASRDRRPDRRQLVLGAVRVDREKIEAEARYDGKSVLRTNVTIPAEEVAVQYERLLLVSCWAGFRAIKPVLSEAEGSVL